MLQQLDSGEFIAELESRAQSHRVPFEGGLATWRHFGDGPPLVLLHGGHGCWLHWARNILALAGQFMVCVPDMPGYGESDSPVEPSLASLVNATQQTLDALVGRAAPITLAGFSFGALVASHLALQRGAVTSLVLLGPAGHGGARRPRGDLHDWHAAAEQNDLELLSAAMRHNLLMHMLHSATSVDAVALHIHTQACLRARFRSKRISRSGGLLDCLERLAIPVRMAWGEHDVTAIPSEAAQSLTNAHPHRDAIVFPGAGHWVQFEAADAVNTLLLRWLKEATLQ